MENEEAFALIDEALSKTSRRDEFLNGIKSWMAETGMRITDAQVGAVRRIIKACDEEAKRVRLAKFAASRSVRTHTGRY